MNPFDVHFTINIRTSRSGSKGRSSYFGFTLVELLIVIAIIGTLAGIAVPLLTSYVDRVRVARAKAEIRTIEKEIIVFYIENDSYPDSLADIGFGGIKDPYGNPYQYLRAPSDDEKNAKGGNKGGGGTDKEKMRKDHNLVPVNTDFDLYSMGKDGESKAPFTAKASRDDIARANNGQFIGLVSSY